MIRITYWLNRQTTLTMRDRVDPGRLVPDYLNGNGPESRQHTQKYVFKTDNGQRIPVSHSQLRVRDGGLVLKTKQTK